MKVPRRIVLNAGNQMLLHIIICKGSMLTKHLRRRIASTSPVAVSYLRAAESKQSEPHLRFTSQKELPKKREL